MKAKSIRLHGDEMGEDDESSKFSNAEPRSLREIQKFVWQAISRPLTGDYRMRKRWIDGRDLNKLADQFVLPSKNMSSFDRLEIYNQQYWYRLLDCFDDDFPGLKSLLGEKRFSELTREYLSTHPSGCFTLRDLGVNLVSFLKSRTDLIEPDVELCLEMAGFEWARVVAFDGLAKQPIDEQFIKTSSPENLKLSLQPYVTLLELNYALDVYAVAFNRHERDQSEAGSGKPRGTRRKPDAPWPVQEKVYLVVHRHENTVYLKRVDLAAFVILSQLLRAETLNDSVMAAVARLEADKVVVENLQLDIQEWFALWMRLGWFCIP